MPTGKEDILQALVEAYIMEKGTKEFYALASSRSAGGEAKRTFSDLAKWETQHMAYIQSLYQSLQDDRELEEFSAFSRKVPAPEAEGGIPVRDLEKRIETHAVKDEHDALTTALAIEARSHKLYQDLAKKAADTGARVIFEEMMSQEMKHLEHLNTLRKAIGGK